MSPVEAGRPAIGTARSRGPGQVGLALALFFAAGCGSDADKGRMAVGTAATAHGEDGGSVPVFFSEKTERLPVGSRVKVVDDREGDPGQPRRKVVVSIQSGPWQGMAAQMDRSDLRPDD